jgi:hypothetical protein
MNLHIYVSYLKVLHFSHGGLKLLSILAPAPGKRRLGGRKEVGKPLKAGANVLPLSDFWPDN